MRLLLFIGFLLSNSSFAIRDTDLASLQKMAGCFEVAFDHLEGAEVNGITKDYTEDRLREWITVDTQDGTVIVLHYFSCLYQPKKAEKAEVSFPEKWIDSDLVSQMNTCLEDMTGNKHLLEKWTPQNNDTWKRELFSPSKGETPIYSCEGKWTMNQFQCDAKDKAPPVQWDLRDKRADYKWSLRNNVVQATASGFTLFQNVSKLRESGELARVELSWSFYRKVDDSQCKNAVESLKVNSK